MRDENQEKKHVPIQVKYPEVVHIKGPDGLPLCNTRGGAQYAKGNAATCRSCLKRVK